MQTVNLVSRTGITQARSGGMVQGLKPPTFRRRIGNPLKRMPDGGGRPRMGGDLFIE